jgi:hypothetical protein
VTGYACFGKKLTWSEKIWYYDCSVL